MGWETRRGKSYYYLKQRVGGRVVSQYIGTGQVAELGAKLGGFADEERQAKHEADAAAIASLMAEDVEADAIDKEMSLLVKSALAAEGFHQHKGSWRKKRDEKEKTDRD